ncbi:MAG: hypothetical protein JXA41_15690 [Deltaproteobacteria bacterium]|nr:hypothetical protein [Deltaproteobacteria bacterium]
MSDMSDFDKIPIGFEMGPLELLLDQEMVNDYMQTAQWETTDVAQSHRYAPPGMTVVYHSRIKFQARPDLKAAIWAKTEHEFVKPLKMGSTISIRGRVIDKFVKKDRNYLVCEFETRDENGELLMKSRETSLHLN